MDGCGRVRSIGPRLILSKAQKSEGDNSPNSVKECVLDVAGEVSSGALPVIGFRAVNVSLRL